KDEATVDHDPKAVESANDFAVIPAEVLALARAFQATARKRFETYEETSQTGGCRFFDQIVAQDRIDSGGALKDAAHPLHAAEQLAREPGISEKMIVEKIKMPARKARNLGQGIVHDLRVERAPAGEEPVLVAEGAMMRAASRNDNRVRHKVSMSLNEIASYRRKAFQSTYRSSVAALRCS